MMNNIMPYREFFKKLVENPPYAYQERVADALLAGKSLILRAPTGAGKTWSVVLPFLYSFATERPIADRLIYALPLRSLAANLYRSTINILHKNKDILPFAQHVEEIGKDRDYTQSAFYCSLHLGTEQNDPFFESDLLFTTIDQLLSNYVFLPVSLPDKLANINAGALIGTLLVFDEIHLFDPSVTLGTVIEMLVRLSPFSQFVLMTATLPNASAEWLANKLKVEFITLEPEEIVHIPSQAKQQRYFFWNSEPLTAESVWEQHNGGRTIALVNTVSKAQQLFEKLEHLIQEKGASTHLLLLHSRFFPEDRKAIEDQLQDYFGPMANKTDIILVTTQVIEAGIDISADILHTELAPMNTLIQRAGRVARYAHRNKGRVIVYELEEINGRSRLGPYTEQENLVNSSRNILCTLPREGEKVDYITELKWLSAVHENVEYQQLSNYDNLHPRIERIGDAIDNGDQGLLTKLVRDVSGINVLICADPERVFENQLGKRLTWPQLLSVPPKSLIAELGEHFQSGMEPNKWIAKGAQVVDVGEGSQEFKFQWKPISTKKELFRQWLIALHPDYASYDSRYGLRLGIAGSEPALRYGAPTPLPRAQYIREEWQEHAKRVRDQARHMAPRYQVAAKRLSKEFLDSSENFERLVECLCLLHDTGKLAADWQEKALKWQHYKEGQGAQPTTSQVTPCLAHTHFDPTTDRYTMHKLIGELPPHAVEGAYAVQELLYSWISTLINSEEEKVTYITYCLITAIARHHGARASRLRCFQLIPNAAQEIKGVFSWPQSNPPLCECNKKMEQADFGESLLTFRNDSQYWPLYCALVRRLRLADQGAVREIH